MNKNKKDKKDKDIRRLINGPEVIENKNKGPIVAGKKIPSASEFAYWHGLLEDKKEIKDKCEEGMKRVVINEDAKEYLPYAILGLLSEKTDLDTKLDSIEIIFSTLAYSKLKNEDLKRIALDVLQLKTGSDDFFVRISAKGTLDALEAYELFPSSKLKERQTKDSNE